jgi:hypothetical protein
LRGRYRADIAQATEAMTIASRNATGDQGLTEELVVLASQIPVYTGLVETARTNNRQGYPLGAAYLREASGLMRHTLLPAAQRLYEAEKTRLAQAQANASHTPWTSVGLAGVMLLVLLVTQIALTRRTKRIFNVWLLVASFATLALGIWIAVATTTMAGHLGVARDRGSVQAQTLAEARIAALQARADEALTLVARGSGQDFEADYVTTIRHLDNLLAEASDAAPDTGMRDTIAKVRADLDRWRTAHSQVRQLDDGGQYPEAVVLAIGPGAGDGPSLFAALEKTLDAGIDQRRTLFSDAAAVADRDLAGSQLAVLGLTVALIFGAVAGLRPRIAEYR